MLIFKSLHKCIKRGRAALQRMEYSASQSFKILAKATRPSEPKLWKMFLHSFILHPEIRAPASTMTDDSVKLLEQSKQGQRPTLSSVDKAWTKTASTLPPNSLSPSSTTQPLCSLHRRCRSCFDCWSQRACFIDLRILARS